jgi:hypothetical protein
LQPAGATLTRRSENTLLLLAPSSDLSVLACFQEPAGQ